MTHPSHRSTPILVLLAMALAMPLVLNLVPTDGNPLPSPFSVQAAAGTPQGRLA